MNTLLKNHHLDASKEALPNKSMKKNNFVPLESQRIVVVLGMHRSGTSVVTRALAALGVELGENLLSCLPDNPKGFYENRDVVRLDEKILSDMGCHWDTTLIPEVEEELISKFFPLATEMLKRNYAGSELWGVKDPRITRLLSFWRQIFDQGNNQILYILANRHPLSVAASLSKRNSFPNGKSLALWLLHQLNGLNEVLENEGIVVDYDFIVNDAEAQLIRLGKFLGRRVEISDPEAMEFICDFLEKDLRHTYHEFELQYIQHDKLYITCKLVNDHLRKWAQCGVFRTNDLADEARVLLKECNKYISDNHRWFETIDQLGRLHIDQEKEMSRKYDKVIEEIKSANNKLESEIRWMTSRPSYKLARVLNKFIRP